MRPIRLVCLGLLVVVLAGCATAISGHGLSASPILSTGPTPEPSPTATASPAVTAAHDLGDPRSADLCTLVRRPAYRSFGTATLDTAQPAATCYATVTAQNRHQIGLTVTAMPAGQARSRNLGRLTTVAGLSVVRFAGDPSSCQRDVWTAGTVLSAQVQNLTGAGLPVPRLCKFSDELARQIATAVTARPVPRRPLASPSLIKRDMCRGVRSRDLAKAPFGAALKVTRRYYPTFCHATNGRYTFGVEVVFRKAGAKPVRKSKANGHPLAWFDPVQPSSLACDVTSIQRRTADANVVEAVDLYLVAFSVPLRGQKLCDVLATTAGRVLTRLRLR